MAEEETAVRPAPEKPLAGTAVLDLGPVIDITARTLEAVLLKADKARVRESLRRRLLGKVHLLRGIHTVLGEAYDYKALDSAQH